MNRNFDPIDVFFIISISAYFVFLFVFIATIIIQRIYRNTETYKTKQLQKISKDDIKKVIEKQPKKKIVHKESMKMVNPEDRINILNKIKNIFNKNEKFEPTKIEEPIKPVENKKKTTTPKTTKTSKSKETKPKTTKTKTTKKKTTKTTSKKGTTRKTPTKKKKTGTDLKKKNYKNNVSYVKNNPKKKSEK